MDPLSEDGSQGRPVTRRPIIATPHERSTASEPPPAFKQRLGLFDATMLVVGTMIGSGIFMVSAEISRDVGSAGWLLAVWILTGGMTLSGSLCYAELAGMMPHAGGQYVYLREAYSPLCGFLYGWTLFLVIQTGSIAAVAVAFANFLGVLAPSLGPNHLFHPFGGLPTAIQIPIPWKETPATLANLGEFTVAAGQLVAVAVISLLTLLNCRGVQDGKRVQNIFTVAKTSALTLLIVLGLLIAANSQAIAVNMEERWVGIQYTATFQRAFDYIDWKAGAALMAAAAAMTGSLFSADAWNNVTFMAGEVRNPRRNLPLSLMLGVGMVMVLYLLANITYLAVLPAQGTEQARALWKQEEEARGNPATTKANNTIDNVATFERGISYVKDDRVATAVMEQVSTKTGPIFMALAVMVSTFGCVNGMILMGARLYYAMACDGLFFQLAGRLNHQGVPAAGLLLQGAWSVLLVFSGSYSKLLDYVMLATLLFYAVTVIGLFVLRRKQPSVHRPYRVFGYPLLPAAYVSLSAVLMLDWLVMKPSNTWPGLILVLSGIPVYFFWRRTILRR